MVCLMRSQQKAIVREPIPINKILCFDVTRVWRDASGTSPLYVTGSLCVKSDWTVDCSQLPAFVFWQLVRLQFIWVLFVGRGLVDFLNCSKSYKINRCFDDEFCFRTQVLCGWLPSCPIVSKSSNFLFFIPQNKLPSFYECAKQCLLVSEFSIVSCNLLHTFYHTKSKTGVLSLESSSGENGVLFTKLIAPLQCFFALFVQNTDLYTRKKSSTFA